MSATDDDIEASSAPLIEHLAELRTRLIRSVIGFAIMFVICFYFADKIFDFLLIPYQWAVGENQELRLIFTAPQELAARMRSPEGDHANALTNRPGLASAAAP